MDSKYVHFLGNEANDTILSEIYGLETATTLKSKKLSSVIMPKICAQCNESNIPDSRFCTKCRMVLTYDAYTETLESEKRKDDQLAALTLQLKQQQILQEEQKRAQEVQQALLESIAKTIKMQISGIPEKDLLDKDS